MVMGLRRFYRLQRQLSLIRSWPCLRARGWRTPFTLMIKHYCYFRRLFRQSIYSRADIYLPPALSTFIFYFDISLAAIFDAVITRFSRQILRAYTFISLFQRVEAMRRQTMDFDAGIAAILEAERGR